MKKIILLLLFSTQILASSPYLELSIDKSIYAQNESSILVAEVLTNPHNPEYEFLVDARLNNIKVDLDQRTDFVWTAISESLTVVGENRWDLLLVMVNSDLYRPLQASLETKKSQLSYEYNPGIRTILIQEVAEIQQAIQNLKIPVKNYQILFQVQ